MGDNKKFGNLDKIKEIAENYEKYSELAKLHDYLDVFTKSIGESGDTSKLRIILTTDENYGLYQEPYATMSYTYLPTSTNPTGTTTQTHIMPLDEFNRNILNMPSDEYYMNYGEEDDEELFDENIYNKLEKDNKTDHIELNIDEKVFYLVANVLKQNLEQELSKVVKKFPNLK